MAKVKTTNALPKGVLKEDLNYPAWDAPEGERMDWKLGDNGVLRLYHCKEFGWCVSTLHISKSRNAAYPARTYGIRLSDNQVVTMGGGPHVDEVVTVYVRKHRLDALQPLLDAYDKGMDNASTIRNRIGSRRAQGSLMRSQGRTSWMWNV